jgi:SOS-response transcriptional repressor LexA
MKKPWMSHSTDTTIQRFALGRLDSQAARRVQEHLLICDSCSARLAHEDDFREGLRLFMARQRLLDAEHEVEAVGALIVRHVPNVLRFRTHLPVYSLAAAAGAFGRQQAEIRSEGWIAVPSSHILITPDMFVVRVIGTSMEPAIPNGALCAFSSRVSTPCEGKIVLLEDYEESGGNRYCVKRYHASMRPDPLKSGDPGWLHERITLESINSRFPPLEISSDHKINVIGEFAFAIANTRTELPLAPPAS